MRKYELGEVDVYKRGRLPHWNAQHAIYCVTWHLNDALPLIAREKVRERKELFREFLEKTRGPSTYAELVFLENEEMRLMESVLDLSLGECVLRDHRIAKIVADALEYFDGQRYELFSWCVMPNHVHVIFSLNGWQLSKVLHSWKSFTSKEINRVLGRQGTLWQAESYDRCVRDASELQRQVDYVVNNPSKAELFDWPFVRTYPARIASAL